MLNVINVFRKNAPEYPKSLNYLFLIEVEASVESKDTSPVYTSAAASESVAFLRSSDWLVYKKDQESGFANIYILQ